MEWRWESQGPWTVGGWTERVGLGPRQSDVGDQRLDQGLSQSRAEGTAGKACMCVCVNGISWSLPRERGRHARVDVHPPLASTHPHPTYQAPLSPSPHLSVSHQLDRLHTLHLQQPPPHPRPHNGTYPAPPPFPRPHCLTTASCPPPRLVIVVLACHCIHTRCEHALTLV